MTDPKPTACSLEPSRLLRRLDEIAEVGAGLIAHETENGRHMLRFHSAPATRRDLEKIVAAEAECCSFLSLELSDHGDELVLTLTAPDDDDAGQVIADELAAAFTGGSW